MQCQILQLFFSKQLGIDIFGTAMNDYWTHLSSGSSQLQPLDNHHHHHHHHHHSNSLSWDKSPQFHVAIKKVNG